MTGDAALLNDAAARLRDPGAPVEVALPVGAEIADWLVTEAILFDARGPSVEGHTFHALRVARAVLGQPADGAA